jgi:hypothetical protein
MRIVLLSFLLFFSCSLFSQKHFIGVRSGLSLMNASYEAFIDESAYKAGGSLGLFYEFLIENRLSCELGLSYNQRGFNGGVEEFGITSNLDYRFNYLSLPFQVRYSTEKSFYGFSSLGIMPSILTYSIKKSTNSKNDSVYSENYLETTNVASRFDLAVTLETGGGFKFDKGATVYASVSFLRSLTSVSNEFYLTGRNIKHYGFLMNFGIRFAID